MASEITPITMPKWGLTMTEGKVVGWLKREGEAFAEGEELLEIETTKITNVFEAPSAGTLRRIVAPAGTTRPIGGLLAVAAEAEVPQDEIDAFIAQFAPAEAETEGAAAAEAPTPGYLDLGGRRLRYLDLGAGSASPVLLIHGFGADLDGWMFTQPVLAEGRRALALDLPGHGGSDKEVGAGDADAFAAVVVAALDALGIERVHLVGHSMGGAIAALAAQRRPDRVASLSLIAAAGLGTEINRDFIDGFVRATRRREAIEALTLLVQDKALVGRRMVEDLLRYKRLDGVPAALANVAAAWFPDGRQLVDIRPAVERLAIPVQLIWGREDRIIPVAHAEALAESFPVHILDRTGHLPHMERAGEVNRLLGRLLDERSSG